MKISRQVGTTSEILQIFIRDSSDATGEGLANVLISTFSSYWMRNDQTSTSSITLISTGSLGTYSSGAWTQINSTFMKGWYQFGVPDGIFAAGRSAALHIYGATNMAETPIEIELTKTDNQTYVSSQGFNLTRVYGDAVVTSFAGVLQVGVSTNLDKFGYGVSSNADKTNYGISSFGFDVGVSSFNTGLQVGVSSFNSRVGVSSFGLPVGVSSFNTGLQVGVSSFGIDVGVSSVNTGLRVGVSSFGLPVGVSSFGLPVGVSSIPASIQEAGADALLLRNVSSGANGGRSVREAFYVLRNRVDLTGGIVYGTDDTASSWAFTVSTAPVNAVVEIDPS